MKSAEATKRGLGPLPSDERLQCWEQFSWEKGRLWGHPIACTELTGGMEETQPGSSQQCVVGGQEAAAQAEIQEAQAGAKEKPFSYGDSPAMEPKPRESGPSLARGVSCLDWVNP